MVINDQHAPLSFVGRAVGLLFDVHDDSGNVQVMLVPTPP
jgi:hypothetical protein